MVVGKEKDGVAVVAAMLTVGPPIPKLGADVVVLRVVEPNAKPVDPNPVCIGADVVDNDGVAVKEKEREGVVVVEVESAPPKLKEGAADVVVAEVPKAGAVGAPKPPNAPAVDAGVGTTPEENHIHKHYFFRAIWKLPRVGALKGAAVEAGAAVIVDPNAGAVEV